MPIFENGPVTLNYEDSGSGIPLLVIPGGGLNSNLSVLHERAPIRPFAELAGDYRVIAMDLRNAPDGASRGPLEIDRPWDAHTDDQLALMDHLGIDRFLVMGFCIGGPFTWNLLRRAGERIPAAVMVQPSGSRPENRDLFFNNNMKGWGPRIAEARDDVAMADVERFLDRMYRSPADFVFTVTRDFVRACQTPVMILPDDIPAHPYAVAMEAATLAPNAEVSLYPWADDEDRRRLALQHVRTFLKANRDAVAAG